MEVNNRKELPQERIDFWQKEIITKDTVEIATLITDLETRATRDSLTGLINKEEFSRQFKGFSEGAFRRGSRVYVAFLDVDNLKKVNDTGGHAAGDILLKHGVDLLKSSFRLSDIFGRLQGDEFLAGLECEETKDGHEIIEKIIQRVVSNLENGGVSVSIGLSEYKKGEYLDEVIKRADNKMMIDKTIRKAGRDY